MSTKSKLSHLTKSWNKIMQLYEKLADVPSGPLTEVQYLPAINGDDIFSYYGGMKKSSSEVDSEHSYPSIFSNDNNKLTLIFLPFNIMWIFSVTLALSVMFMLLTYEIIFNQSVLEYLAYKMSISILYLINLVDILSSTLHYCQKKDRRKQIYAHQPLIFILLDLLSLISVPMQILHFIDSTRSYWNTIFVCIVYRLLHRVSIFITSITSSPLRQSLRFVLLKYSVVLLIFVHVIACTWMCMGCLQCDHSNDEHFWTDQFVTENVSMFYIYMECLFIGFNLICNSGLVVASKRNNNESLAISAVMLITLVVTNGVFLGTFTSVLIDQNRKRSLFAIRFKILKQQLSHEKIAARLRARIATWYLNFWLKEKSTHSAALVKLLPVSMYKEILLDKYWYAINQSHILRNAPMGLKRSIACGMSTSYYDKGEVLAHQDKPVKNIFFIATGLVHMVAPDDVESPIVTFGIGTCLFDINLVITTNTPVSVIAASYCKVYVLHKRIFWNIMSRYYKVNYSRTVIERANFVINNARLRHIGKLFSSKKQVDKTLKLVKENLEPRLNVDKINKIKSALDISEIELSDMYIISKIKVSTHRDAIFIRRSWPWILHPNSQLVYIWETITIIFAVFVIIFYPYLLFYQDELGVVYKVYFRPSAYVIFIADIIVQLFTSLVDEQENLITSISELIAKKMTNFTFLLDIISVLPIELMFGTLRFGLYCHCNHMLKLYRIVMYTNRLTKNVKFGNNVIKICWYILYLLYLSYVLGMIYFVVACPKRPCNLNSWVGEYKLRVNQNVNLADIRSIDIMFVSMLYGLFIISGTGGRIFLVSVGEKYVIAMALVCYLFLYTYLLADYSASLTLAQMLWDDFISDITTMRRFLTANKMKRRVIDRINEYQETQWVITKGVNISSLMSDIPWKFHKKMKRDMYIHLLLSVPLFQILDKKILTLIAGTSTNEFYPSNEYVVYAGSRCVEMYIIEKGFCELKFPGSECVIGPLSSFCVVDMLLDVPILHNVRTLTNVSLLRVSRRDIDRALCHSNIKSQMQQIAESTKNILTVDRLFAKSDETLNMMIDSKKNVQDSFFYFTPEKLHPLNIDYYKGWHKCRMLRHLLCRRTILPDGKFLYIYVIFYSHIAFLSSILNPCIFIYECFLPRYVILMVCLPLDFLCFLDIYLRLHVCYYNKDGILVTHPRCTAQYYLTTSFAVDFITSLPLFYILNSLTDLKFALYIILFVKTMKCYRIPNAFSYFNRDILKNKSIIVNITKFVVMSIILINSMSAIVILIGCDYTKDEEGRPVLQAKKISWAYTKTDSQTALAVGEYNHPLKIYTLAIYFITCTFLQLGSSDMSVLTPIETLFLILAVLTGFIWFTYILVIISNTKAVINRHLTNYQDHMKLLLKFMKQQHLPKYVQSKSIRYFEYLWQRTQGTSPAEIFSSFNKTLKNDCNLNLYYDTLSNIRMFKNVDVSFFALLTSRIQLSFYLQDFDIIRVHNIVDSIYIVHRGEVMILGPTGEVITVLKKGGIFGNIDNVRNSRSMMTARSKNTVDIIYLNTSIFYAIVKKYPSIEKTLIFHIRESTGTYINDHYYSSSEEEELADKIKLQRTKLTRFEKFLMTRKVECAYMLSSLLSYMIVIYHTAFQRHDVYVITVTYSCELFHVLKVYLHFMTPFINSLGEIVTNKKQIKRRYLKTYNFYLDLVALIPLEIVVFTFMTDYSQIWMWISWFRLNKIIRGLNIQTFYSVTDDYLNVPVVLLKLGSVLIYLLLIVHSATCIWYTIACPNRNCAPESWTYDSVEQKPTCRQEYICALYFTMTMLTFAGCSIILPRSYLDVVGCVISLLCYKFIMSIIISNLAALVRHYGYQLGRYALKVNTLKSYLNNGQISYMLQERTIMYFDKIWYTCHGQQLPIFLNYAQETLKEEIKVFAFGNHIFNNILFHNCHSDFLRQLITRCQMLTFFHGNTICVQGDIDETMYFIHLGSIDVFLEGDEEEMLVDCLDAPDCFGMIQGLFPKTPHSHTYRAKCFTQVVTLMLRDWIDLLTFFPASQYNIYSTLKYSDGTFISTTKDS